MKLSRRVRLIVISVIVMVAVLVVANLPWAKLAVPGPAVVRADGGCSVASLSGAYAVEGQGTIVKQLPGFPAPPFPFGEATLAHFNGDGTGSASATVNFGGDVVLNAFPVTISYAVNSDCTGNLTVNTSLGLAVHEAFVVVAGGQRFITTETDPFAVVQRRGERLTTGQD